MQTQILQTPYGPVKALIHDENRVTFVAGDAPNNVPDEPGSTPPLVINRIPVRLRADLERYPTELRPAGYTFVYYGRGRYGSYGYGHELPKGAQSKLTDLITDLWQQVNETPDLFVAAKLDAKRAEVQRQQAKITGLLEKVERERVQLSTLLAELTELEAA